MLRPMFPVLFCALVLAACSGGPKVRSSADLTVTRDAELPAPTRNDLVAPQRSAYLGPLDTITIETFGVSDLTRTVVVDGGGLMSFPLVGVIDVNGMTARELSAKIEQGLRGKYVRNPDVTVTIKEQVSQFVTIDGSVQKPGQFPVTNNSTLMRSMALSGGLSDLADSENVVVLRTVGQKRMAGLYNLGAIRAGAYPDPAIYPNDTIIVGESGSRRFFRNAIAVAPLLVAPLIAVLNNP